MTCGITYNIPPFGEGCDVTVIIAHFNCADLLPRALESVLEQSHPNWICVVVDDATPDIWALSRLRSIYADPRIRWLRTSANVGQFRIYNKLLPLIVTPYLALQDADDWSDPQRFERLLEELNKSRCDVVGSAVTRVSVEGKPLGTHCPPLDVNKALAWRYRRSLFVGPTMLCRTSFLRQVGGFDGTTRIAGDTEFISRAVFQGSVRNHTERLYFYTERPGSLTKSPMTGFGSTARILYARQIRRNFYRHILLWRVLRIRPMSLKSKVNNIDFRLTSFEE